MPGPGFIVDRGLRGVVYTDKSLKLRGASVFESHGAVVLFDDFIGDTLNTDLWTTAENGVGTPFAINTAAGDPVTAHGGWIRATTAAAAGNDESMAGELIWKPTRAGNGLLVFETRLSQTEVTSKQVNAGLFDTKAPAGLQITLSAAIYTTNAVDGVGFVYDTDSDNDDWNAIGVKAGVDSPAVEALSGAVLAVDTAHILRLEIDSSGNAYVYYGSDEPDDVVFKGASVNATTATVALAPYIGVQVDDAAAAAKTLDCDYILVACKR